GAFLILLPHFEGNRGGAGALCGVHDLDGVAVASGLVEVHEDDLLALALEAISELCREIDTIDLHAIQEHTAALGHLDGDLIGDDDVLRRLIDLLWHLDLDLPHDDWHRHEEDDEQHEDDVDERRDVDVALRLSRAASSAECHLLVLLQLLRAELYARRAGLVDGDQHGVDVAVGHVGVALDEHRARRLPVELL